MLLFCVSDAVVGDVIATAAVGGRVFIFVCVCVVCCLLFVAVVVAGC